MAVDDEKGRASAIKDHVLAEAERSLRAAGYTVAKEIHVNFSQAAFGPTLSDKCTGGCEDGCYTCSPGNSNKIVTSLHPTFQIAREAILEDLITVIKAAGPGEPSGT
jgi:hypothetical protein